MEKNLSEIINSLNKAKTRRFRGMFRIEGQQQGYFKLFSLLQKYPKAQPEELARKFKSPKEYSKAKSDLFSKLVFFLSGMEKGGKIGFEKLKWAWEHFLQSGQFELAARAVKIASRQIVQEKLFALIPEIVEAEKALPFQFQPATSGGFRNLVKVHTQFSIELKGLSERYAGWSKMVSVPPPAIPALRLFENDLKKTFNSYLSIAENFQSSEMKARFLRMLKVIASLQSQFSEAIDFQISHIQEIRNHPFPAYKKEVLLVNECKNFCALLQENQEHHLFWEHLKTFTSLHFQTPNGKSLAQIHQCWLMLAYNSEYGIESAGPQLIDRVKRILPTAQQVLKTGQLLGFMFMLGRFQFMTGRLSEARNTFGKMLNSNQGTKGYKFYFPYVTMFEILIAVMEKSIEVLISKRLSLQRFLKGNEIKYQFFGSFFELIDVLETCENTAQPILPFRKLAIEIKALESDSFEGFPFAFFQLGDFAQSLSTGKPFPEILNAKISYSPENLHGLISGGESSL